ncbi:FUSC family protein [Frondihabitans sp. VKM Ac-2883]|uniref:FUSC family protein n=1 Tax=Frondihabitans sp. VKM Ac-2883 TaxID=2783823 RepID=UPI00188DAB94|nr:FUSC family protein [Frondihabitans sp. VKM Ac-2883]MBF4576338.1 FUSC family protein [Frondihabitans sp. VKM Ac-2883]
MPSPGNRRALRLLAHPRILLAVKAALAAALAWWIAPHVPGTAADYPYYAPLGAVVSMYPTVKASLTQGIQTLAGLVLGIGLAAVVVALGNPTVLTVALVIGVGVLLGGLPLLGAGRDWVPMAGLFVLLIGGSDSEDYSWGYAVQMLVGIVVGVVINFTVVPPLYSSDARDRLQRLHSELADRADDLAGVFRADWPLDGDEFESRIESLPVTLARVRAAVDYGDESQRWNPRRRRRIDLSDDRDRLRIAERIAFHLRDAAEVTGELARRGADPDRRVESPGSAVTEPLAALYAALADAIRAHDDRARPISQAEAALDDAWAALDAGTKPSPRRVAEEASVALSASRILVALAR